MGKTKKKVPEVRFTITKELDLVLNRITQKYGISKSDYVRSLIIKDLREKGTREE